jgi:hypothetical protein
MAITMLPNMASVFVEEFQISFKNKLQAFNSKFIELEE